MGLTQSHPGYVSCSNPQRLEVVGDGHVDDGRVGCQAVSYAIRLIDSLTLRRTVA